MKGSLKRLTASQEGMEPVQTPRHNLPMCPACSGLWEARRDAGRAPGWESEDPDSSSESVLLWTSLCPSIEWGFGLDNI